MDIFGGKLFGIDKRGSVPVLDIDSPWKKKILNNAIYFKYESVSAASDVLKTIIGTLKSDCDLELFENSFERRFRHGKLLTDSPNSHGVSEDKETLTDPETTEEENRISYLNYCEELEKKLNELTTERDEEKYLRQGCECVFQMMKEEYIRVTSALKAKYSHKIQQLQDILDQTVNEKLMELEVISNKLDDVEIERDDFQKQVSDLLCTKTKNTVEDYDKMLQSLNDEKTAITNQYEALLSKMMTENNALKVDLTNLKQKVDHLNIVKNNHYEELQRKDSSLRNQEKLLKSKEETINILNNENKMIQENNVLSVDALKEKVDHLTLVENNYKAELQRKDNELRDQKELLQKREEMLYILNEEKKVLENNLKISVEKLAAVTSTVHETELKVQKELKTLLSNLQKETKTVQEHEHFIEFITKGNKTMLLKSDALLNETKLYKSEVTKLKRQVDDLILIKNNLGKELETKENSLRNQKELLNSQEETICILNNEKKVIQNNLKNAVEKIAAVTSTVHKSELKVQKELRTLLTNLQEETMRVQKNEQLIESLYSDNRNMLVLSEALLNETVKRKTEISNLKQQIDDLISIKNNLCKELQTKDNLFRKKHLKIRKELQEVLLKLQKESSNVQKYEQMIEYFNNENYTTLRKMKTQNNLLKFETSDLKQEVGKLSSVKNNLHEELQTRDNELACLNTDVLFLRNDLELALEMVRVLTTDTTESKSSQSEHTNCKQVTDEKNVTLLEMENLIVNQLKQKIEILQANLNSKEYELQALRNRKQKADPEDTDKSSLSIYYENLKFSDSNDHISNVSDEVRVELATLKREIMEQKQREDKTRKTFDQEKHQLQASIRLEQQKNEQMVAAIEGLVQNFEQKLLSMKTAVQDEKHKSKKLIKLLAKSGILVENTETNMMGQGDQSSDSTVSSRSGK